MKIVVNLHLCTFITAKVSKGVQYLTCFVSCGFTTFMIAVDDKDGMRNEN